MPSIHAILFVALGGAWGADPGDYRTGDPPAAYDPFSAPAESRAPAPRQPLAAANGTAPVTVPLAPPPLPGDESAPDQYPAPQQFAAQDQFSGVDQNVVPAAAMEPSGGGPNETYLPAAGQWSGAAENTLPADAALPESSGPPAAFAAPPAQRLPAKRFPCVRPGPAPRARRACCRPWPGRSWWEACRESSDCS